MNKEFEMDDDGMTVILDSNQWIKVLHNGGRYVIRLDRLLDIMIEWSFDEDKT
jgi:hypothetical protein